MESTEPAVGSDLETVILKKYYTDYDLILSAEGILKILSALGCLTSSLLYISSGGCGAYSAAGGAAGAALLLGLYATSATALPARAPYAFLFTDLIVCSVVGGVLLVAAVLCITLCQVDSALDYVHMPLAIMSAGLVIGSSVVTYSTVTRLWDAARAPPNAVVPTPSASDS